MKIMFILLMSVVFIGCSSSGKKMAEESASEASESASDAAADVTESAESALPSAAPEASSSASGSCDMKPTRSSVNFGSPKVTSRAFRRLRLRAKTPFTVTEVSSMDVPFGYYNSGSFPGEATYHNYSLCDTSTPSKDCSINLQFRPRAVNEYTASITVSYKDSSGGSCSVDVPLKGTSTESYLGKDSSKGLPDN